MGGWFWVWGRSRLCHHRKSKSENPGVKGWRTSYNADSICFRGFFLGTSYSGAFGWVRGEPRSLHCTKSHLMNCNVASFLREGPRTGTQLTSRGELASVTSICKCGGMTSIIIVHGARGGKPGRVDTSYAHNAHATLTVRRRA